VNNITCKNVEIYTNCIKIQNSKHSEILDVKFINVTLMSNAPLMAVGDTVIIKNIQFDGIAGTGNGYEGAILSLPRISTNISNVVVQNSISMPSFKGFIFVNSDTS
jgi:hypothetical protein